MKNLKKLSLALMLATLFSTSFTSCIDNEVSPLVEAIYAAQADLIAAQAAVQNAEAALRLARATAEEARAALYLAEAEDWLADAEETRAETAADILEWAEDLRLQIAENDEDIAEIMQDMAEAALEHEQEMMDLLWELAEAGAVLAGEYADDYYQHLTNADQYRYTKYQKENYHAQLALMLTTFTNPHDNNSSQTTSFDFFIGLLEAHLSWEEAKVVAAEAAIAMYEEAMANPSLEEEQIAGLEEAFAAFEDELVDLEAQLVLDQNNINEKAQAISDATAFMANNFGSPWYTANEKYDYWYTQYQTDSTAVVNKTAEIANLEAILADYEATTATLLADYLAVLGTIGSRSLDNHPDNHADASGLLGDIEAIEIAAGVSIFQAFAIYGGTGTKADNPVLADDPIEIDDYEPKTSLSLLEVEWNAKLAALKTAKAVVDKQAEVDALVASYNAAAVALANIADPQPAIDALGVAQGLEDDALADLVLAQTAYTDAQTVFEADPGGFVIADVDRGFDDGFIDDLGETDDPSDTEKTYMWVNDWVETSLGSNMYVPSSFGLTILESDLAATAQALVDAPLTENGITDLDDIYIWEQDGVFSTAGGGIVNGGPIISIDDIAVVEAATLDAGGNFTTAYLLEVGADDTSTNNLYNFNVATNELGQDDFGDRAIIGDPLDGDYNGPLVAGDNSASYDSTPDAEGEENGGPWELTAQAVYWNAQLATAEAQFIVDTAAGDAQEIQDEYDAQKILFDNGVAEVAALQLLDDAADAAVTAASAPIGPGLAAWQLLHDEVGIVPATVEASAEPAWFAARDNSNPANLPISWDVHANDGLAIGSEMYDVQTGPLYAWDSDDDGEVDSLTAYAALWNALNVHDDHLSTSLSQYETDLANAEAALETAMLEMAEDLLFVENYQEQIDALQAQYDELMASPLMAQMLIDWEAANQAKAATMASWNMIIAQHNPYYYDVPSVGAKGSLDLVHDAWVMLYGTDYTTLISAQQAIIDAAPLIIANLEAAIAQGEVDKADVERLMEITEAAIATLADKIAAEEAQAAAYYQLMIDALAS